MCSQASNSDVVARAMRALNGESDLELAILYGSAAAGKMRGDSDVDIAVLFKAPLDADHKMELITRLQSELKRDVDIVDLFHLNGTLLKQILCRGRVLIKANTESLAALTRRMIYNESDMMPYVMRTLMERQRRFIHG